MDSSQYYVLPSHPSKTCLDPLGLCDEDSPTVWTVITACLDRIAVTSNIYALERVIDDLSYSIHMKGDQDMRFLRQFLLERYPDPAAPAATSVLNRIVASALELPTLFPAHTIPYLSPSHSTLQFTHAKVKCLLSHQILNTLCPPKGNTWGCTFTCWYSDPQPLEAAVMGYLSTVFDYFEQVFDDAATLQYQYITAQSNCDRDLATWTSSSTRSVHGHLVIEPTTSTTVPFPNVGLPCTLVASNKEPGFGPSCTQEELVTAACPPLLILGALLVSPPVPPDAALLVSGTVPLAQWRGQRRDARPLGKITFEQHTFLFLDATELDTTRTTGALPADLHPDNLLRDLVKCQIGFSALRQQGIRDIAAPLWGAGAFGGDPVVKTLAMAMAAARENIIVRLSVDENRSYACGGEQTSSGAPRRRLLDLLLQLQTNVYMDSDDSVNAFLATFYGEAPNSFATIQQDLRT